MLIASLALAVLDAETTEISIAKGNHELNLIVSLLTQQGIPLILLSIVAKVAAMLAIFCILYQAEKWLASKKDSTSGKWNLFFVNNFKALNLSWAAILFWTTVSVGNYFSLFKF